MPKTPDDIDAHVGRRMRLHREREGVSQVRLAAAIGVTFQQVQKYEKGTNRVSASRLQQAARVLGVTVDAFYEGISEREEGPAARPEVAAGPAAIDGEAASSDAAELVRAFDRIKSPAIRQSVIRIVKALGE